MGKDVVGVDFRDSVRCLDGFVETVKVLQSPCHSVKSFGESRIGGDGLPILFERLLVIAFGEVVESGVIVVFGLLARIVRHERRFDSSIAKTGV